MMAKKRVEEIGGLIHGLSLASLLNEDLLKTLEEEFGHVTVSQIHIDLLDDKGKDVEDVLLLYRSRKERSNETVTLLCDKPSTFKRMVEVVNSNK